MAATALGDRLRQRLLPLAGVVLVALSLLAMHQLSVGHRAADPRPTAAASMLGDHAMSGSMSRHSTADPATVPLTAQSDQAGAVPADPDHGGACPGCGDHQGMALGCLVALSLLVVGLLLVQPPRLLLPLPASVLRRPVPVAVVLRRWRRPPRSLLELSISRT